MRGVGLEEPGEYGGDEQHSAGMDAKADIFLFGSFWRKRGEFVESSKPLAFLFGSLWRKRGEFVESSKPLESWRTMSDKRAAGQARKAAQKEAAQLKVAMEQNQIEDKEWEIGTKKASKKQVHAEQKAAAAAERKALAKAQEQEENSALAKPKGDKNGRKGGAKVTRAELAAKALAVAEQKQKESDKKKKAVAESGGNDYMGELTENLNAPIQDLDESGVDAALAAMNIKSPSGAKAQRMTYKVFEERELAGVRSDHPGLKLSQHKELCFKMWQKSPENPANELR